VSKVWTWQEARELTGVGIAQIRQGMEAMSTSDPLLGACYAAAAGLAVNIKGDRHAWNVDYATTTAADLIARAEGRAE
jgi:hypothetical protein